MVEINSLPKDYKNYITLLFSSDDLIKMRRYIRLKFSDFTIENLSSDSLIIYSQKDKDFVCTMTYDSNENIYELYRFVKLNMNSLFDWCLYILDSKFDSMYMGYGLEEFKYCFLSFDQAEACIIHQVSKLSYIKNAFFNDDVGFAVYTSNKSDKGIWIFNHANMWRIMLFDQKMWSINKIVEAFLNCRIESFNIIQDFLE